MSCTVPLAVQYRTYQGVEYYDGVFAQMGLLDYFDERGISDVLGMTITPKVTPNQHTGIMLVARRLLFYARRFRRADVRVISIDVTVESPTIRGFREPEKMNGLLYSNGYAVARQYLLNQQASQ